MYVKHLIKLMATEGWRSIYHTARHQVKASDSNIWYALKRLKEAGVVTENSELTDLGWRLFKLIEATEQGWVRRDECVHLCGSDAIETGKELRIIEQRNNAVIVKEIKDPSPQESSLAKRDSKYSELAVEAFNAVKGLLEGLNPPPLALDWLPASPPNPPLPRLLFDRRS